MEQSYLNKLDGVEHLAEQEHPEFECADSPPTRRRVSRWQQLKALADGHHSNDTDQGSRSPADVSPGKQHLSRSSAWSSLGQLQGTGSQGVSDDVADVLARCVEQGSAAACTSSKIAEPNNSQLHILPDGSLTWGNTGPDRRSSTAGDTLLQLLQPDPSCSLGAQHSWQDAEGTVCTQAPQASPNTAGQQQLDLTGVFDYLHTQQQQHQKSQSARNRASRAACAPGRSTAQPSSSATVTPKKTQAHSSSWGAPRRPAPLPQQPARTPTHSATRVPPAQQAQQLRSPAVGNAVSGSRASSRQSGAVPGAAAPKPRPVGLAAASKAALLVTTASSSSSRQRSAAGGVSTKLTLAAGRPLVAAAAANPKRATAAALMQAASAAAVEMPGPLQQELSTCSSSYSARSSMQECQAELELELAAVHMFRVLRRWRLAAADVALDRARARPMHNLLSKRKAVRGWRMAMAVSRDMSPKQLLQCHQQQQQQQALLPADRLPRQQRQQQQSQQQSLQQQHLQPQASQGGVKRAQVASQFHRLYRQHCCLLHWHAWAVAAAEARRQQQELENLQERQRAVNAQQEALLAEFEQRQQQELQQQQEHTRMQVATRFHALYMLHSALRTWHKHASITAALNKLHPVLPPKHAAAAAAAVDGPGQAAPGSSSSHKVEAGAVAAAGMLDPVLIQQKAQQLLQHLASKTQGAEPQQEQRQPTRPAQQGKARQKPGGIGTAPAKGASVQHSQRQAGRNEAPAGRPVQLGTSSAAAVLFIPEGPKLSKLQPASTAVGHHSAAAPAAAAAQTSALETVQLDVPQQQQQTCRVAVVVTSVQQQMPAAAAAEGAGVLQPLAQDGGHHSLHSTCSLQKCDIYAVAPLAPEQPPAAACAASTDAVIPAAEGHEPQEGSGGSMVLLQQQPAAQDALQPQHDEQQLISSHNFCSKEELRGGSPSPATADDDMLQQPPGAKGSGSQQQQQQSRTQPTDSPDEPQPPRLSAASQRLKALSKARHSSPHKRQLHDTTAPTGQDAPAAEQCTAHAEGADLQASDSQTPQQQQQDWPQERQRLQQQIRQLQAEEQRRNRQYQLVEQQLQALLAQQQAAVAEVHACRALVMRAGLGPWLRLMRQRAQQWQLAWRLYKWHLLNAAMVALKHALVVRYKRHTCRHVQAWGKLRGVRQQHQQQAALSALAAWTHAGRHYRRQLVVRCLQGWRAAAVQGVQWLAAAAAALRGLRQHQVVAAWWKYVQDQAHEQLMVELELTSVAANWHTARLQRCALHTWRTNAAAAAQQRLQEAAHQQTWSRVRGWLSELDGGVHGPPGVSNAAVCEAGRGAAVDAGGIWGPLPAGTGEPAAAAEGADSTGWDLDELDPVFGVEDGAVQNGASGSEYGLCVGDAAFNDEGVAGGDGDTGSVGDLAALAEWFDAAGRGIQVASECSGT